MSNRVADLDRLNRSPQAQASRQARKDERTADIASASEIIREKCQKQAWSLNTTPDETRSMMPGMHPGDSAIGIVHEALGDYNLGGTLTLRYGGMDRKAGRGGHGIEEGTIYVEGALKPITGMTAYFTVPVVIRQAKMLFPGMLVTAAGVPRVLAQSTFDDLSAEVTVDQAMLTDRHQFDGGVVNAGLRKDWSELRQVLRQK